MQGKLEDVVRLFAVAVVLAICGGLPPSAGAAPPSPEPGVPVPVAPGVPGQGRVWELTTPPDPIAAGVSELVAVDRGGDRTVFWTRGAMPGAEFAAFIGYGASARGAAGWSSGALNYPFPESASLYADGPLAFGPDLGTSLWENELPDEPGQPARSALVRTEPAGKTIVGAYATGWSFLDSSEDLSRIWFSSSDHLLPSDATRTSGSSIYEIGAAGTRQVDVDNLGQSISECGAELPLYESISLDEKRVVFRSPGRSSSCPEPPRVYMREGGAVTEISASQCTRVDCNAPREVEFVGQSSAIAYLMSEQQLTDDDTDELKDLYGYRFADGDLERISTSRPTSGIARGTFGPRVWSSRDGSRIYFGFSGFFYDGGPDSGGGVYLIDDHGLRFVGDNSSGMQVTPDGRYALMKELADFDPADTDQKYDLYRFDAVTGDYARVSGVGESGNGEFEANFVEPFYTAGVETTRPFSQAISEDGRRILFETTEQLVPGDRNDLLDVYEWVDGGISLVSGGVPDFKAEYMGSTPDLSTVVFRTAATLVPEDRDLAEDDLYAARIGGGFPAAPRPPSCDGQACRAPATAIAPRSEPATARSRGGRVEIARLSAVARKRMVAEGAIELLVEAPAAGRLSLRARAKLGGRQRTIASASRLADGAGTFRLRAPLSAAARRALARGKRLEVRAVVSLERLAPSRPVRFALRGQR